MKREHENIHITFSKLFILFIFGSLLGVCIEGLFYLVRFGYWETHVVSIWLPLCTIYGAGAVLCFILYALLHNKNRLIHFLVYCGVGFSLELVIGLMLEFGLGMRAWNYTSHFLNIRGHVSLQMTVGWGCIGIIFSELVPYLDHALEIFTGKVWTIISIILFSVTLVDTFMTSAALKRYSDRHYEISSTNSFEDFLDKNFDDDFMSKRFVEWKFLK